jgi:hypothetical protein
MSHHQFFLMSEYKMFFLVFLVLYVCLIGVYFFNHEMFMDYAAIELSPGFYTIMPAKYSKSIPLG